MSKTAACEQSDARIQIYKVIYTHHDAQPDKGISGTCSTANVYNILTGFDTSSTLTLYVGDRGSRQLETPSGQVNVLTVSLIRYNCQVYYKGEMGEGRD